MSASHDMYHLKKNNAPPNDTDNSLPLTPEEYEKYISLLTLAYPQPKGSIRDAVMSKIAAERAEEAEKSKRKTAVFGKPSVHGRFGKRGKCDLACAFDETAKSGSADKADKVRRLKNTVRYASAAACLGIAALTAVVFLRYSPKTVDTAAMGMAGNYSVSDIEAGSSGGNSDNNSDSEIIKKYTGSNSYRAKSYSMSAQAEDAAIAEETAPAYGSYSLYSNKMMSPGPTANAEEMKPDLPETAEEAAATEFEAEEAPEAEASVEEPVEAPVIATASAAQHDEETGSSEAVENTENPAEDSTEEKTGGEDIDEEAPTLFLTRPANGFSNSTGMKSPDSQSLTTGSNAEDTSADGEASAESPCSAGLMKLSSGLIPAEFMEDAPIPTDCRHSAVFKNSYHDIPKALVNIVGKTTFNLWANSVVCETGDVCSVNIAEFYAHFSEVDSEFPGKFAAACSGDVTYYCDLPDLTLFEKGKIDEIKAYYENGGDYASAVKRYFEYEYKNEIIGKVSVSGYTRWLAENGKRYLRDWTVEEIAAAFALTEADLAELYSKTEEEFPYSMEYVNE